MADWSTIASLATAAGTLALAVSTFVAVRSSHASARITERALLANIRPVLVPSRFEDPVEKVGFADDHWLKVPGGAGVIEVTDEAIYLAISIRNVGSGLGVLDRWDFHTNRMEAPEHRDPALFSRLTRDLYIPPHDSGFWQGAFRESSSPEFAAAKAAIESGGAVAIDLLYGDHEGGQRTITRFGLIPRSDGGWLAVVSRHWHLDRDDPR